MGMWVFCCLEEVSRLPNGHPRVAPCTAQRFCRFVADISVCGEINQAQPVTPLTPQKILYIITVRQTGFDAIGKPSALDNGRQPVATAPSSKSARTTLRQLH